MSGHNKWSTIKRKKGANDAARAKIFTKIGRELAVAVKNGGPDPNNNAKLRDVIAKAKQNNVPNDNIDRMLKKAAGEGENLACFQCSHSLDSVSAHRSGPVGGQYFPFIIPLHGSGCKPCAACSRVAVVDSFPVETIAADAEINLFAVRCTL